MLKDVTYWLNRYHGSPVTNRAMIYNRNRKLGKETYHFMLSPDICTKYGAIAQTKLCFVICYAKKNNYTFPHVIARMKINYEWSLTDDFVEQIVSQIQKIQVGKHPMKRFRIHSSGDFYDENYWQKWLKIVSEFPSIKFMAYTRNIHIAA